MASDASALTIETRTVVNADLGGAHRVPLSLWAATAFAQRLRTRSQAKKAIAAGLLCITGQVTTSGSCVSGGETVTLRSPTSTRPSLYEDNRFLVKWCSARDAVSMSDVDWYCALPNEGCGLVLVHSTNSSIGSQESIWEYVQDVVCVVKGAPIGRPGESVHLGLSWGEGYDVEAEVVEEIALERSLPLVQPTAGNKCAGDGKTLGTEALSTLRLHLKALCCKNPPKLAQLDSEPVPKLSLEVLLATHGLTIVRAARSDNMLLACVKIVITRRQPHLRDGSLSGDASAADPEVVAVVERAVPPSFAHSRKAIARAYKTAASKTDEKYPAQRTSHAQQQARKLLSMVRSLPGQSFLEYLREQQVVPASEQSQLEHILQQPLCCSFRINSVLTRAQGGTNALAELQQRLRESVTTEWSNPLQESTLVRSAQPIPWYMPTGHAWQMGCDAQLLRRHARSGVAEAIRAHDFLVCEAAAGRINRQEAVSMIPPLLLDVRPGHHVLDMCAAPGSKSAQLLEAVAAADHIAADYTLAAMEGRASGGLLVANELDSKRAHVLAHQLARLDATRLVVTSHDASEMPALPGHMGFDRVLCDVPCSGDGTARKSPLIWGTWHAGKGLSFHELQLRIAKRGCELLAVGGLLVYSTCSFNPIENEAVVTALIQHARGAIELLPTENSLPGLLRRPGLTHWRVGWQRKRQAAASGSPEHDTTGGLQWYDCIDSVPESLKQRLQSTMFAPKDDNDGKCTCNDTWSFDREHLRRCIRIVPQDQNTGAFFVAVLRKVADMPPMRILSVHDIVGQTATVQEERYHRLCDDACRSLSDYWGISTDILEYGNLFTRQRSRSGLSSSCPGSVWLLHADVVRSLGLDADTSAEADNSATLNVLHAGTKLFTPLSGRGLGAARAHGCSEGEDTFDAKDVDHDDSEVLEWRLFARMCRPVHSALMLLAPHMTRRVIDVELADMRRLVRAAIDEGDAELLTDSLSISEQIRALTPGPAVARIRCDGTGAHARALTFWAGTQRVRVMLSNADAQSLLAVVGESTSDSKHCAISPEPPSVPAKSCSQLSRTEESINAIEPVHAVVSARLNGRRVYHAAGELFDVLGSATAARKLVKRGAIMLNGTAIDTVTCVSAGDRLTLDLARVPLPPAFEMKLDIAFVDEHFAVVCKPPGLVTSGNGLRRTLSLALPFNLQRSSERTALLVPRPVHRLDAGTQGLVLVARTSDANVALGAALAGRKVRKRYRAIVAGRLDGKGCVDIDVGSKTAKSSFVAVEHTRSLHLPSGWITTVDLWPHTGRKHQLRVHMASLGHPILGDKLYLDRASGDKLLKHKGLFLAAIELELDHPVRRAVNGSPERVHVEIAEPTRFAKFRQQNARRWDKHHEGTANTNTCFSAAVIGD